MSRLCIFSDIHGNIEGFHATLEHALQQGCDDFLCLGDIVDGGDYNDDCVRLIREREIPVVRGNHDEDCSMPITDVHRDWLRKLPEEIRRGSIVYTHIGPGGYDRKINTQYKAYSIFDDYRDFRLLFIGHMHYPFIFGAKSDEPLQASLPSWKYSTPFSLNPADRYIICPGSIGYPRDGLRQLRYTIFDEAKQELTMIKFPGPLLDFGF